MLPFQTRQLKLVALPWFTLAFVVTSAMVSLMGQPLAWAFVPGTVSPEGMFLWPLANLTPVALAAHLFLAWTLGAKLEMSAGSRAVAAAYAVLCLALAVLAMGGAEEMANRMQFEGVSMSMLSGGTAWTAFVAAAGMARFAGINLGFYGFRAGPAGEMRPVVQVSALALVLAWVSAVVADAVLSESWAGLHPVPIGAAIVLGAAFGGAVRLGWLEFGQKAQDVPADAVLVVAQSGAGEATMAQAFADLREGRFEAALAKFTAIGAVSRPAPELLRGIIQCHVGLKHPVKAAEVYQQLMTLYLSRHSDGLILDVYGDMTRTFADGTRPGLPAKLLTPAKRLELVETLLKASGYRQARDELATLLEAAGADSPIALRAMILEAQLYGVHLKDLGTAMQLIAAARQHPAMQPKFLLELDALAGRLGVTETKEMEMIRPERERYIVPTPQGLLEPQPAAPLMAKASGVMNPVLEGAAVLPARGDPEHND